MDERPFALSEKGAHSVAGERPRLVYDKREAESKDGVAILHCLEALASNLQLAHGKYQRQVF